MNKQQVTNWLQTSLAASGPIAALILTKTGISVNDYTLYLEVVLMLVPGLIVAGFGWYRNRTDTQIKITKDLPGVARVVVSDSVNGKLREMAHSDDTPNIVTESQNRVDVKAGAA